MNKQAKKQRELITNYHITDYCTLQTQMLAGREQSNQTKQNPLTTNQTPWQWLSKALDNAAAIPQCQSNAKQTVFTKEHGTPWNSMYCCSIARKSNNSAHNKKNCHQPDPDYHNKNTATRKQIAMKHQCVGTIENHGTF